MPTDSRAQPDDNKSRTEPTIVRKPYTPPRLIAYGHITDIIQGGTGHGVDAGGGHSKNCWIAEALYGVDDPRTRLLRAVDDHLRAACSGLAMGDAVSTIRPAGRTTNNPAHGSDPCGPTPVR